MVTELMSQYKCTQQCEIYSTNNEIYWGIAFLIHGCYLVTIAIRYPIVIISRYVAHDHYPQIRLKLITTIQMGEALELVDCNDKETAVC